MTVFFVDGPLDGTVRELPNNSHIWMALDKKSYERTKYIRCNSLIIDGKEIRIFSTESSRPSAKIFCRYSHEFAEAYGALPPLND